MNSDDQIKIQEEDNEKEDSSKKSLDKDSDENVVSTTTTATNNNNNEDADEEEEKDNGWILELETALLSDCDINVIRKMSTQQTIPNKLRYEFWQTCLGIKGRTKILEDIFDLPEQNLIRNDCKNLVEKLNNINNFEKLSIVSDLESIITNFSRLNHCRYDSENGWIELLETLIYLNIKRDELFKIFETIQLRYITKFYNCSQDDDHQENKEKDHEDNNLNDGKDGGKEVIDKTKNLLYMQPFHLLRLLLLYHDPELCNYFDTIKLTPEMFANTWFRSLFCSLLCNHDVSLKLLDAYFIFSNPFMIFYLSLVMIINLKDELKTKQDRKEILQFLKKIPTSITESDINDMFFIAEQHFLKKTPVSVKEFQKLLFQVYPPPSASTINLNQDDFYKIKDLSNLLCLPISVQELLQNCQDNNNNSNKSKQQQQQQNDLNYFVVDCRPPDQYNNGHLLTAFHLDCSLMLNDPSAFNTAVQALLSSQKQALDAKSLAGGEHLCFIGTGFNNNDNDDQDDNGNNVDCYIPMVVSSFLQKHHKYVSLLIGGYKSLHNYILANNLQNSLLIDHNQKLCIYCLHQNKKKSNNNSNANNQPTNQQQSQNFTASFLSNNNSVSNSSSSIFFQKFQNVLKPKINEMKEKLVEYVVNPTVSSGTTSGSSFHYSFINNQQNQTTKQKQPIVKHVSAENLGKRYKGSKFSLDDDLQLDESFDEDNQSSLPSFLNNNDQDNDDGNGNEINIDEWKQQQQILGIFDCSKINSDGSETPGFLSFNKTDLFIIKKLSSSSSNNGNNGKIIARRPLEMIYQITSKRKCPEIITFKYGSSSSGSNNEITNFMAKDSLILIEPFEVIRLIKQQVVLLLDQQQQQQQSNDTKKSNE